MFFCQHLLTFNKRTHKNIHQCIDRSVIVENDYLVLRINVHVCTNLSINFMIEIWNDWEEKRVVVWCSSDTFYQYLIRFLCIVVNDEISDLLRLGILQLNDVDLYPLFLCSVRIPRKIARSSAIKQPRYLPWPLFWTSHRAGHPSLSTYWLLRGARVSQHCGYTYVSSWL